MIENYRDELAKIQEEHRQYEAKIQQERKIHQEKFAERSKKLLNPLIAEIFHDHPWLESFGFKGYTMYFNDGEDLYFRVNTEDACLIMNGESGDELIYSRYTDVKTKELASNAANAITTTLDKFSRDEWKLMFGDHWKLMFYRDGKIVRTEYIDHE